MLKLFFSSFQAVVLKGLPPVMPDVTFATILDGVISCSAEVTLVVKLLTLLFIVVVLVSTLLTLAVILLLSIFKLDKLVLT